jgi:hypothetical protein
MSSIRSPVPKTAPSWPSAAAGQHRRLVDDVKRVVRLVEVQVEARRALFSSAGSPLAVDRLVDRIGRRPGIAAHHLRRPARRSHQHARQLHLPQGPDQRPDDGRFPRPGVAVNQKNGTLVTRGEVLAQAIDQIFLLLSWRECKITVYLSRDMGAQ